MFTACSSDTDIFESDASEEDYSKIEFYKDPDTGRLSGEYENILFNVLYSANVPENLGVYEIEALTESNYIGDEGFGSFEFEATETYSWTNLYENESLIINQQYGNLANYYLVHGGEESNEAFKSYVMNERFDLTDITKADDAFVELTDLLGADEISFNESLIKTDYHGEDGYIQTEYAMFKSMDGIPILCDGTNCQFPKNDTRILYQWNNNIYGYSYSPPTILTTGSNVNYWFKNTDTGDIYNVDLRDYKILDIVEENLKILTLEECIANSIEEYFINESVPNAYVYYAQLSYMSMNIADEDMHPTDSYYLVPVWALYYTSVGTLNNTFNLYGSCDGLIVLNAVTGENMMAEQDVYISSADYEQLQGSV